MSVATLYENKPILVWPFDQAPPEYQALSAHGGDEDWFALLPPCYDDQYVGWAESGTPFGCCDVSQHILSNGYVVRIGAHA